MRLETVHRMKIILATKVKQVLSGDKIEVAFRVGAYSAFGDLLWYGLLAGSVWLVFHVCCSRWLSRRRISKRLRKPGQLPREISHSIRSIAIFGLVAAGVLHYLFRAPPAQPAQESNVSRLTLTPGLGSVTLRGRF